MNPSTSEFEASDFDEKCSCGDSVLVTDGRLDHVDVQPIRLDDAAQHTQRLPVWVRTPSTAPGSNIAAAISA